MSSSVVESAQTALADAQAALQKAAAAARTPEVGQRFLAAMKPFYASMVKDFDAIVDRSASLQPERSAPEVGERKMPAYSEPASWATVRPDIDAFTGNLRAVYGRDWQAAEQLAERHAIHPRALDGMVISQVEAALRYLNREDRISDQERGVVQLQSEARSSDPSAASLVRRDGLALDALRETHRQDTFGQRAAEFVIEADRAVSRGRQPEGLLPEVGRRDGQTRVAAKGQGRTPARAKAQPNRERDHDR